MPHIGKTSCFQGVLLALVTACTSGGSADDATSSDAIVGGTSASADYPEFVTIDLSRGICSGVMLSSSVVLTAGHCAMEAGVVVHRGNVSATGDGVPYEYYDDVADEAKMDATIHDVGLIIIQGDGIDLPSYPRLADAPVANGTEVVTIGRVRDGDWTQEGWAAKKRVSDAAPVGFPLAYVSDRQVGQSGDSGGPVMLPGPLPHTIVAVHSRRIGTLDAPLDGDARIDLVKSWITSHLPSSCEYTCAAYGYSAGECRQGWACDSGCLKASDCR
jgi:hypothetical protein